MCATLPALQALLDRVADQWGAIQVLVNNAGRDDRHALDDLTPEYWDNCLAINLRHQVFATQTVARQLRAAEAAGQHHQHGLDQLDARAAEPDRLHRQQGRHLGHDPHAGARTRRPDGIRVNALVPGAIVTERQTMRSGAMPRKTRSSSTCSA
jgi:NAD(P)-dependent dehydrogenase (short-subunit alcohol dehydrogenase family)